MNDSDAQKLLGEPWRRGEMQHTCVVHNSFSFKCLQGFLQGEKLPWLHSRFMQQNPHAWRVIQCSSQPLAWTVTLSFDWVASPALKLLSKEGNCTFTPEQGARPFLHLPLHMWQLWQLLTLGPALSTRQGDLPCKQLLQSTYSFPWRVIKANFPQDCPQGSKTGTWNGLGEHASRRTHCQSSLQFYTVHREGTE